MRFGRLRTPTAAAVAFLLTAVLGGTAGASGAAGAGSPPASHSSPTLLRELTGQPSTGAQAARLADPNRVLPSGWSRSKDEVLAVQGDASGLHVLVASESSGYAWRTVTTLGDPGVETSQWIGTTCLAGAGRYAVVVYAPREVTNMAGLMGILGRAAVVNLATGSVSQLGGGFSVAYFDPGCGTGDNVVLTKGGWGGDSPEAPATTGLQVVNAATGQTVEAVTEPGQVTSAVPYRTVIAAANQQGLVQISARGQVGLLARSASIPFRLVPDAAGGIGYETSSGSVGQVYRFAGGRTELVGRAAVSSVQLQGSDGQVWLTGSHASGLGRLPGGWRAANVPAGSLISTTGTLAVTGIGSGAPSGTARRDQSAALPVVLRAQVLAGHNAKASFAVATGAAPVQPVPSSGGGAKSTAGAAMDYSAGRLGQTKSDIVTTATAGSPSTPVSADRTCAIPVDDPSIQAYQPDYNQVEWAADEAVQGDLTDTRPAGLYGSTLPSYTPQGLFGSPSLAGGGTMPAQVLLGVLTQESNLEQASAHDIQGQASNPLTSFNWYGDWVNTPSSGYQLTDPLTINWDGADCGYGIGQVTSGMCLTEGQSGDPECQYSAPMSAEDQLAVAVDYQANIAAAMQILSGYWNELHSDGIGFAEQSSTTAPDPEADYINSWYMALWAYNSGLEPGSSALGNTTGCKPSSTCTDGNPAGGDWGLGYADNPVNPVYPPDRPVFPGTSSYETPSGGTYSPTWDMSNPEYWTYQEKVLSWAYNSITLYNYNTGTDQQAFAYASGNPIYPPLATFCTSADNCNASGLSTTSGTYPQADSCTLTGSYQDHCWWHWPVSWSYCNTSEDSCGLSVLTYAAGAAAPANPTIAAFFAQQCTETPLPSTAVIVGADEAAQGCPGQNWTSAGSMTWSFAADTYTSPTTYPSKINFDQIGSGLGGHFWFGYTIPNNASSASTVTSTTPAAGYADLEITGTWPAPSSVTGTGGWTQVYVHIPNIGAWDEEANYQISPGGGQAVQHRIVNQAQQQNMWISLGIFDLESGANVSLSNVTKGGLGDDIAWNDVAFVHSAAPTADYVAMGDSYSSGEGNQPFDLDSDYSNKGLTDACHRSGPTGAGIAYSNQFDLPGETETVPQQAATPGSGVQYQFLACSGEVSSGMDFAALDSPGTSPTDYGSVYGAVSQTYMPNTPWVATSPSLSYNEIPQVDTGWLNDQTTLVTITAGGDDARFAKVLAGCIGDQFSAPSANCANGGYTLPGDPAPLTTYEPEVIGSMAPHLYQLYKDAAEAAPDAEIVVMGYPRLFAGDRSAAACPMDAAAAVLDLPVTLDIPSYSFDIPAAVTQWMNYMGDQLNSVISAEVSDLAATGVDIHFINPNSPGGSIAGFEGHNICDASGNNPPADGQWINGLITYDISGSSAADQGPEGLPVTVPGSGSFHPSPKGQLDFAELISECLEQNICPVGSYK